MNDKIEIGQTVQYRKVGTAVVEQIVDNVSSERFTAVRLTWVKAPRKYAVQNEQPVAERPTFWVDAR